jgi:gliding motility-associated-like protein
LAITKYILSFIAFIVHTAFSYGQSPDLGTVCAESKHTYGVSGYVGSSFIWVIDKNGGIIADGDGTDTVKVHWGYNTGTYQMEVVEYSSAGCVGAPVIAYTTIQAPEVDLGFDFYEICDGESFVFDASGSYVGTPTYVWQDNSTSSTYQATFTEDIWVEVTDGSGCTRKDSLEFIAHALPTVYLGNDTILCDIVEPYELDGGDFYSFEWTTNNDQYLGNPIYIYPSKELTDTIRLTVTDENGCYAYDTLLVYACDVATLFADRNNTFTPNGDGVNETWVIIDKMDQFPDAVLEIFDRWGRLVYRTGNVTDEPWDGKSKGRDMPMDAYFYVLDLNYANFDAITGTVNLIR